MTVCPPTFGLKIPFPIFHELVFLFLGLGLHIFWGCIPVVCENFKKTKIPSELYIPVRNPADWIASINNHKLLRSVYNNRLARDFVLENHSASKFYDRIFSDDCEMVQAEPQESLASFFV